MVILSFFILNTTNEKLSNPRRRRRRPFVAFGEARAYPIKIAAFRRVFRVRRAPDLAIACLSEFIRVRNEMTHEVLRLTHHAQVGLDFAPQRHALLLALGAPDPRVQTSVGNRQRAQAAGVVVVYDVHLLQLLPARLTKWVLFSTLAA